MPASLPPLPDTQCIVVLPLVFIPPLPFVWVIAMLYSLWIAFAIVQVRSAHCRGPAYTDGCTYSPSRVQMQSHGNSLCHRAGAFGRVGRRRAGRPHPTTPLTAMPRLHALPCCPSSPASTRSHYPVFFQTQYHQYALFRLSLTQIAVTVSMAVGYILARRYLHKPACRFLNRYRHVKAVLMSVDAAGPFRVALLIRLGPLPFTIENYGEGSGDFGATAMGWERGFSGRLESVSGFHYSRGPAIPHHWVGLNTFLVSAAKEQGQGSGAQFQDGGGGGGGTGGLGGIRGGLLIRLLPLPVGLANSNEAAESGRGQPQSGEWWRLRRRACTEGSRRR